jgi:hypothetical protein
MSMVAPNARPIVGQIANRLATDELRSDDCEFRGRRSAPVELLAFEVKRPKRLAIRVTYLAVNDVMLR